MLILSQEAICQTADDEARFKTFWKEFARVVQAGDTAAFKKMSLEKITCLECLTNTDSEKLKLDTLTEESIKNRKPLDRDIEYIHIEEFLKNDYDLVFDLNLIANLNDISKINFSSEEFKIRKIYGNSIPYHLQEVLKDKEIIRIYRITLKIRESFLEEHESEVFFGFIETKEGFKLSAILMI